MFLTFDLAFPAIECNCFCAPAAPEFSVGGGRLELDFILVSAFSRIFHLFARREQHLLVHRSGKVFLFFIFYSVLSVVYLWRSRFGIW